MQKMKNYRMKINSLNKEIKEQNIMIIQAIKIIKQRKHILEYIEGILSNKDIFNKNELIKIIYRIKEKVEKI